MPFCDGARGGRRTWLVGVRRMTTFGCSRAFLEQTGWEIGLRSEAFFFSGGPREKKVLQSQIKLCSKMFLEHEERGGDSSSRPSSSPPTFLRPRDDRGLVALP